jgi:hypothetical protein
MRLSKYLYYKKLTKNTWLRTKRSGVRSPPGVLPAWVVPSKPLCLPAPASVVTCLL